MRFDGHCPPGSRGHNRGHEYWRRLMFVLLLLGPHGYWNKSLLTAHFLTAKSPATVECRLMWPDNFGIGVYLRLAFGGQVSVRC
jgi:hypothetical protein